MHFELEKRHRPWQLLITFFIRNGLILNERYQWSHFSNKTSWLLQLWECLTATIPLHAVTKLDLAPQAILWLIKAREIRWKAGGKRGETGGGEQDRKKKKNREAEWRKEGENTKNRGEEAVRENVHPAEKKKKKNITISFTFLQHHPQELEAAEPGTGNKKRDEEKVKEARNHQTKLSITIGFSFPSTRGEKGKKLEEQ